MAVHTKIFLALILPALTSGNGFLQCSTPTTHQPKIQCYCELEPHISCFVGTALRFPSSFKLGCQDSHILSASAFSVKCDKWRKCSTVNLTTALAPARQSVKVENCLVTEEHEYLKTLGKLRSWHIRLGTRTVINPKPVIFIYASYKWPVNAVAFPKLRTLKLIGCGLTRIPTKLLVGSENLRQLNVSNNLLTYITAFEFSTLFFNKRTEKAIFDHNQIHNFGDDIVDEIMAEIVRRGVFKASDVGDKLKKSGSSWKHYSGEFMSEIARIFMYSDPFPLRKMLVILQHHGISISFGSKPQELTYLSLNHNRLKTIPPIVFGFGQLSYLSISYNRLTELYHPRYGDQIFKFMGRTLTVLNLNGNRISRIPEDAFEDLVELRTLNLADNGIKIFPSNAIPSKSKLRQLMLDRNKLRIFSPLYTMPYLRFLNLSHNLLTTVDALLLTSLASIEVLDLSYNNIIQVNHDVWTNMIALQQLDLSFNRLQEMPSKSFRFPQRSSAGSRVRLILSGTRRRLQCNCHTFLVDVIKEERLRNELPLFFYPAVDRAENLTCQDFRGRTLSWPEMRNVKAYRCRFTKFGCEPTCQCCRRGNLCPCLRRCHDKCECSYASNWTSVSVECSNVQLSTIPRLYVPTSSFQLGQNNINSVYKRDLYGSNYAQLETFNLSYCHIHYIEDGSFEWMGALHKLYLHHNQLKSLSAHVFSGLRNLEVLTLNGNQIRILDPATFSPMLKSLRILNIKDNSFTCDCNRSIQLSRWLEKNYPRFTIPLLTCQVTDEMHRLLGARDSHIRLTSKDISPLCENLSAVKLQLQERAVERRKNIILGVSLPLLLICLITAIALAYKHRYNLRLKADLQFRSPFLRRTLGKAIGLSAPHTKRLDVGVIAHESEAAAERDICRHLTGLVPRQKRLRVERIAYSRPGATTITHLNDMAESCATFIVLLSPKFLEDVRFSTPLSLFLARSVDSADINVIPIFMNEEVKEHPLYKQVCSYLNQYQALQWGCDHFWERLLCALPPSREPSQVNGSYSGHVNEAMGSGDDSDSHEAVGLIRINRNRKLADVCIIAHSEDRSGVVRQLYDRMRQYLSLCLVCNGKLFGAGRDEETAVEDVLLMSSQVVVVLTENLLTEQSLQRLTFAVRRRLQRLNYLHSIIVLYPPGRRMIDEQNALREDFLVTLDDPNVTDMDWDDGARSWSRLSSFLIHVDGQLTDDDAPEAMSEVEYENTITRGGVDVLAAAPQIEDAIFRQHQAEFFVHDLHTREGDEALLAQISPELVVI